MKRLRKVLDLYSRLERLFADSIRRVAERSQRHPKATVERTRQCACGHKNVESSTVQLNAIAVSRSSGAASRTCGWVALPVAVNMPASETSSGEAFRGNGAQWQAKGASQSRFISRFAQATSKNSSRGVGHVAAGSPGSGAASLPSWNRAVRPSLAGAQKVIFPLAILIGPL